MCPLLTGRNILSWYSLRLLRLYFANHYKASHKHGERERQTETERETETERDRERREEKRREEKKARSAKMEQEPRQKRIMCYFIS